MTDLHPEDADLIRRGVEADQELLAVQLELGEMRRRCEFAEGKIEQTRTLLRAVIASHKGLRRRLAALEKGAA